MISAVLAIFGPDNEWADIFFFIALIVLWIVGIVALVQKQDWLHGAAWIALGFLNLGLLFLTP